MLPSIIFNDKIKIEFNINIKESRCKTYEKRNNFDESNRNSIIE